MGSKKKRAKLPKIPGVKVKKLSTGGEHSIEHVFAAVLAKVGGEVTLMGADFDRVRFSDVKVVHVHNKGLPNETHVYVELRAKPSGSEERR